MFYRKTKFQMTGVLELFTDIFVCPIFHIWEIHILVLVLMSEAFDCIVISERINLFWMFSGIPCNIHHLLLCSEGINYLDIKESIDFWK